MSRFKDLVSSFLLGEVSPKLYGRGELDQYKQSCEEITNMVVYQTGGAGRRAGSQHKTDGVGDVNCDPNFKTATTARRSITYSKSKTESYIIVFSTDTSFQNGISVWDIANEVFVPVCVSYQKDSEFLSFPGVVGSTGFPSFLPDRVRANIGLGYQAWEGYDTEQKLNEIQYATLGNAIFFAQGDHPPFALDFTWVSDTTLAGVILFPWWGYSMLGKPPTDAPDINDVIRSVPFQNRNLDSSNTIDPSAATDPYDPVTLINALPGIFTADYEGQMIKISNAASTKTGVGLMSLYVSATDIRGELLEPWDTVANPAATSNWAWQSWSDILGWPRAVCFFENRLIYGGTKAQPGTVWGSKAGNVSDFKRDPYLDTSVSAAVPTAPWPEVLTNIWAFEFTIASSELNAIQWLSPAKTLAIGTLGREYVAFGPDNSLSLGPLNVSFSAETAYGSAAVQPVRRDNALFFIQRSGRKVKEFVFSFVEDSYKAQDVMKLATHIVKRTEQLLDGVTASTGHIVQMAHQEADDQLTWFRDSNYGLFSVTRDKDAEIIAFHYHYIGGKQTDSDTMAKVLSICAAPSPDGTHDDLWMVVRRIINGDTVTYLEKIGRAFELESIQPTFVDDDQKPFFVDSAKKSLLGGVNVTHSGFDHLEGESVQVVADGHYVGYKTVTGGIITLDTAAREVIAGINYRSVIRPARFNIGSVLGSPQGSIKTIDQFTFRFVRTIGAKFGSTLERLQELEFRDPAAAQNDPIELFTGDREVSAQEGWDTNQSVVVVQDLPFPMELAAIVARGVLYD